MPPDALNEVRTRVESGAFSLDPDLQRAVLARIDDLIAAITTADRALSRLPKAAVDEAAAKMAYVFYASGHGWKRYLADNPQAAPIGPALEKALRETVAGIVAHLEREFRARAAATVTRRGTTVYTMPCAACGGDAVTLTRAMVSPVMPEQLVVSSLSPVTVFRPMSGPRMRDLLALCEAGDAVAIVKHLRETQPGGCDAYCATCDRIFCREHSAIEAQWSGSWHEATYVTCPLGHEHEID